jgi:outer membrane lipoprotein SlyB
MQKMILVLAGLGLGACSTASPYNNSPYGQTAGYGNGSTGRNINCGAGVIGGAAVGGILGNQIGKGKGQDVATAAGATVGAALGATRAECQQQAYRQPQPNPGYTNTPVLVGYDQYGRPVYR